MTPTLKKVETKNQSADGFEIDILITLTTNPLEAELHLDLTKDLAANNPGRYLPKNTSSNTSDVPIVEIDKIFTLDWVSAQARRSVAVHEFGHAIDFQHYHNSKESFMSYSSDARFVPNGVEIKIIVESYKRNGF